MGTKRPTVAMCISQGVAGAWIYCNGDRCNHLAYLTWRRMRFDGDLRDLRYKVKLRCSQCGGRHYSFQPAPAIKRRSDPWF